MDGVRARRLPPAPKRSMPRPRREKLSACAISRSQSSSGRSMISGSAAPGREWRARPALAHRLEDQPLMAACWSTMTMPSRVWATIIVLVELRPPRRAGTVRRSTPARTLDQRAPRSRARRVRRRGKIRKTALHGLGKTPCGPGCHRVAPNALLAGRQWARGDIAAVQGEAGRTAPKPAPPPKREPPAGAPPIPFSGRNARINPLAPVVAARSPSRASASRIAPTISPRTRPGSRKRTSALAGCTLTSTSAGSIAIDSTATGSARAGWSPHRRREWPRGSACPARAAVDEGETDAANCRDYRWARPQSRSAPHLLPLGVERDCIVAEILADHLRDPGEAIIPDAGKFERGAVRARKHETDGGKASAMRRTISVIAAASARSLFKNFRRAGVAKKRSRTSTTVPGLAAAGRTGRSAPPSTAIS